MQYARGSKGLKNLQQDLEHTEYIVVDECGMVGARAMGFMENRVRQSGTVDNWFGRKSMLLFGHHAQLPPVQDKVIYPTSDIKLDPYQKHGRAAYNEFRDVIILKKQMRQRITRSSSPNGVLSESDRADWKSQNAESRRFRELLTRAMDGKFTEQDWKEMYDHSLTMRLKGGFASNDQTIRIYHLFARQQDREIANDNMLLDWSRNSGNPIIIIDAVHSGGIGAKSAPHSSVGGLQSTVSLAVGAPVICTQNLWLSAGIVNGAMGVVHDIIFADKAGPPQAPIAVLVKFDAKTYRGPSYLGSDVPGIVKFSVSTESFIDSSGKASSRTQYPLQLAFALTIYKSQVLY
jgi:ATP-dependent exoDNAse (exonuclease V) alpha subunit